MDNELEKSQAEDRRVEYQALRTEIRQADQACLIMTGFIFTALGALYSVGEGIQKVLWITSFFCFIALLYYTEKRFIIRRIASYISNKISIEGSGFRWEAYVSSLRKKKKLRPFRVFRPYYAEILICFIGSLSPLAYPGFMKIDCLLTVSGITWISITALVGILAFTNMIKYKQL